MVKFLSNYILVQLYVPIDNNYLKMKYDEGIYAMFFDEYSIMTSRVIFTEKDHMRDKSDWLLDHDKNWNNKKKKTDM